MNRIKSIDGWRTFAALGVLWTHTWSITQFQSIKFKGFDLFKAINFVGNGVHFFFVISGFCMYLVLKKNQENINAQVFLSFVKKRWLRIAPAFYFACIFIGTYNYLKHDTPLFLKLLANFFFLQNHISNSVISGPFWSLAVEWYFYILVPVLFYFFNRIGFFKTILIGAIFWLIINCLHYADIFLPGGGWWYYLPGNLIHFLWGFILAYVMVKQINLPGFLHSNFSILFALLLLNFGKLLFSKVVITYAGTYSWIVQGLGPAIMTLGFSWLMYISLKNEGFSKLIGNKLMASFGKISYSFYLWHSFVLEIIYNNISFRLHFGGFDTVIVFLVTLIVLIPISYASYSIFEKFYFKKSKLNLSPVQNINLN